MLSSRSVGFAILAAVILATAGAPLAGANDSLAVQRTPHDSAAASPSDSARTIDDASALAAVFSSMRTGMLVRVLVPDARILEGPFLRTRGDLLLFDDVKDTVVAFGDIDRVWRQKRGRSEAGVVSGIALGLLGAGFLAVAAYYGPICFDNCEPRDGITTALATIGGAMVGAGIGFFVGYGLGGLVAPGPMIWAQIYPAEPVMRGGWSPPLPEEK